jgi:hypothetical protein
MSKNFIIGIIVLCFVSTFMTMVFQYASRGYLHETNPPISGSGHHAAAHSPEGGHHEGTATPGPAVETPMSVETPAVTSTETPAAAPTATETPGQAPVDVPSTPAATPTP